MSREISQNWIKHPNFWLEQLDRHFALESGNLKKEIRFYGWVGEMSFLSHVFCLNFLRLIQVETSDNWEFI